MKMKAVITQRIRTKLVKGEKIKVQEDRVLLVGWNDLGDGFGKLLIVEGKDADLYETKEIRGFPGSRAFVLTNDMPDDRRGDYASTGPYHCSVAATVEESRCDCTGFLSHGRCKHVFSLHAMIPQMPAIKFAPAKLVSAMVPVPATPEPFSDEPVESFLAEPGVCKLCYDCGEMWCRQKMKLVPCTCPLGVRSIFSALK